MKTILISFVAISALVMISCSKSNKDTTKTQLTSSDSLFAVKASQGNLAEIQAAQVSLTNAQRDSVKMFGQMMINDHTAAENSLDSIGNLLQFNMPTTPDSAHIALKAKLMTLQGSEFDSAYVSSQVTDHQTMLTLLSNEMNSGTNAALKSYASKNYPIVQMHLMMADSLQKNLMH
jgi:putative membrane protein